MKLISPDEMIWCERYKLLCDYEYRGQDDLPSGVVHVDIQSIPDFFAKVSHSDNKYVVISSRCDYGLCYQKDHRPILDQYKWLEFCTFGGSGYEPLAIGPRVNLETCKPTDKYSIKIWAHTSHTFNEIPKNIVHWFLTNCNLPDSDVITGIPFGINGKETADKIYNHPDMVRPHWMYINWQLYTLERYNLFTHYMGSPYTVEEPKVPFDKFLENLHSHHFVLCPDGNGIDCYRTCEALYCGAICILNSNEVTRRYTHCPVVCINDLYNIQIDFLDGWFEYYKKAGCTFGINYDYIKWSTWVKKVEEERRKI